MLERVLHPPMTPETFREPRWARFLFASRKAAWLWLAVRLYLAFVFLPAGWEKITSGKWLFGDGSPISGLVSGAISSEDTPAWYRAFLENVVQPNASLFATLVAIGETAVGLGLLVGLLTGFAAFGGVFLNANFVLSGILGSNPALIILGTLLVLAWRNAGWIGLDRVFIPWIHRTFFEPAPPRRAEAVSGAPPPRG
jgi:thiosulfate dehydrogenase (quinone) large subunit